MGDVYVMGAENSLQRDNTKTWHIDSAIIYQTDSWELREGTYADGQPISVFNSTNGQFNANSLEYSAKFLRTLRHPCVLRHIGSSRKKDCYYLITELLTPLDIFLQKHNFKIVEITAGLYNILQALQFLHDKCLIRHKKINTSSVFVCSDGNWKLGGFELAEKYISKNKSQNVNTLTEDPIHSEDIFAFGKLTLHLLNSKENLENPVVQEFVERITKDCLHDDITKRPKSIALQADLFFKNEFLGIKMFLQSLMLKSPEEKDEFFKSLPKILNGIDPLILCTQLLPLLMSRIVFLNSSANDYFLPFLLRPKTENTQHCFLSLELFQEYMIPQLIRILQVHDCQIRLAILKNFSHFAHLFSENDLRTIVLPEVLFGIRDINDELVAASLQALATLVTILGAKVVIGENCRQIFTENCPGATQEKTNMQGIIANESSIIVSNSTNVKSNSAKEESLKKVIQYNSEIPSPDCSLVKETKGDHSLTPVSEMLIIPERSSPDGGESMESEKWSDWEEEGESVTNAENTEISITVLTPILVEEKRPAEVKNINLKDVNLRQTGHLSSNLPKGLGEEYDIMALDIKPVKDINEEDYFADMQPNITLSHLNYQFPEKNQGTGKNCFAKFAVPMDIEDEGCSGWDDSELDIEC